MWLHQRHLSRWYFFLKVVHTTHLFVFSSSTLLISFNLVVLTVWFKNISMLNPYFDITGHLFVSLSFLMSALCLYFANLLKWRERKMLLKHASQMPQRASKCPKPQISLREFACLFPSAGGECVRTHGFETLVWVREMMVLLLAKNAERMDSNSA